MNRRSILIGIGAALATPAIVRAESLMKIAKLQPPPQTTLFELMEDHQHRAEADMLRSIDAVFGRYWVKGPTSVFVPAKSVFA